MALSKVRFGETWWAAEGPRHFAHRSGVFVQDAVGEWRQLMGTGDTPLFLTAEEFARYVRASFRGDDGEPLPRRNAVEGWPE